MAEKLVAVYETALTSYTARSWWSDLPVEARRVPDKLARTVRAPLTGRRGQLARSAQRRRDPREPLQTTPHRRRQGRERERVR